MTAPAATDARRADLLKWNLPLDQSDKAKAANAALRAGLVALAEARESWTEVREAGVTMGPDTSLTESLLRRLAVKATQRAGKTLGLVSASACGLWAVTMAGRIVEVEATSDGGDYLDGVRFVQSAMRVAGSDAPFVPQMDPKVEEYPIRDLVAFADSYEGAHLLRQAFLSE